jgi:O-antigen ligase
MYGQTGCALALISIFGFMNNKKSVLRILFIISFILGMVSIGRAGSRSPVIALITVSIFYLIARGGIFKIVLIGISVVSVIFILINQIIAFLDSIGSSLTVRLTSMIVEKDTSGRDAIYQNTWNLIKESPFFGSFYVIRSGVGAGGYPHNFLLEVFLATGLFGGIPFLILLVISIYRSFKLIRNRHQSCWIVVLYLQIIVYGMFSTGLYSSQDFWVLLFFIISMNKIIFQKNRVNDFYLLSRNP